MTQRCSGAFDCSYQILNHVGNQCLQLGFRAHMLSLTSQKHTSSFLGCAAITKAASLVPFYLNEDLRNNAPHPISAMSYPGLLGALSALSSRVIGDGKIRNAIAVAATMAISFANDFFGATFVEDSPSTFICPNTNNPDTSNRTTTNRKEFLYSTPLIFSEFIEMGPLSFFIAMKFMSHNPPLSELPLNKKFLSFEVAPLAFITANAALSRINNATKELHAFTHQGPLGYSPYVKAALFPYLSHKLINFMKSPIAERFYLPYRDKIGWRSRDNILISSTLIPAIPGILFAIYCESE